MQLVVPALVLVPLLAAPLRAEVLTVDDDPGADFTDLPAAIAAANPGDVLLVSDGTYSAFTLEKRLSILGRADAADVHVEGESLVTSVQFVRLAGLRFDALTVELVLNEAILEGCRAGSVQWPHTAPDVSAALLVRNCGHALISRCELIGYQGCCGDSPWPTGITYGAGSAGLRIESSSATVVDCEVRGGHGMTGCEWNTGGSGLEVRGGTVVVTGSKVRGGAGGAFECITWGTGDPGGDAIWLVDGTLVVRGSGAFDAIPDDWVTGGGGWNEDGFGIRAEEDSAAFWSGTTLSATSAGPSASITAVLPPEPFLEANGAFAPLSSLVIDVRAPAGEPLFLGIAPGLKPSVAPALEGTVWLAPAGLALVPLVGAGQGTPVSFSLALPGDLAALAGLELGLQVVAPGVPGTVNPSLMLATNPVPLIAR